MRQQSGSGPPQIHGHPPLTAMFTIDAMPGLQAPFRSLYDRSLDVAHAARPLAELLHDNFIPASLRDTPKAVLPYLIARDTFVQRLYAEHAGYWQANGEGVENFTRAEWALALDELGGHSEDSFRRTADRLEQDRKSTRLNSSHVRISYAVFCLKKKKKAGNASRSWSR